MRYRLRTLLILMAIGPPIVAWHVWPRVREAYAAWSAGDKVARRSEIQSARGGASEVRIAELESAINAKIERMRQLQENLAELEMELAQSTQESKEAIANVAALEQQIVQIQAPITTFLKPKTSDPPGPLRFSPGIERAMLYEGTQRK